MILLRYPEGTTIDSDELQIGQSVMVFHNQDLHIGFIDLMDDCLYIEAERALIPLKYSNNRWEILSVIHKSLIKEAVSQFKEELESLVEDTKPKN